MASGSQSVVIKALVANLGIAVAKFIAAFISRSTSMLSEAVHSLARRMGLWATEAKVGFVRMNFRVYRQIVKDADLLHTGVVKKATWHFYRSPATKLVGASDMVMDLLKREGFEIRFENVIGWAGRAVK